MSIFGKKDENKEEVKNETPAPTPETGASEPTAEPAKEKTPEELRAEQAMKLNLTLYLDGQLEITNGQNCVSRTQSMYMCFLALVKYLESDISLMTVQALINSIMKQKEGSNIIVPGARR